MLASWLLVDLYYFIIVGGCHQHRDTLLAAEQAARIDVLEAALSRIQALEEGFQDLELALAATQEGSQVYIPFLKKVSWVKKPGTSTTTAKVP